METKEKKSAKNVQKSDSLNVEKIKVNLSKNKDLLTKESKGISSKEIYSGISEMSTDEKKKFRGKIRRNLHNFVNSILGKDRSESEREKSIIEFLEFYKANWKIQDFKIENFTLSRNKVDLKDYSDLLKYVKESME